MNGAVAGWPLVLEFVGLPGGGKTTLARKVLERLSQDGHLCCTPRSHVSALRPTLGNRARQAGRRAAFYMAYWPLVASALRLGLEIRPRALQRAKWLREVPDAAHAIQGFALDYDVVILDQAGLQGIWSATVDGTLPTAGRLQQLVREAAAVHGGRVVVFHLVVDPATALERITSRQSRGSRFDRLPRERALEQLDNLQGRFELIVDCAARATHAPVLRLDGHASIDELAERCVEFASAIINDGARR